MLPVDVIYDRLEWSTEADRLSAQEYSEHEGDPVDQDHANHPPEGSIKLLLDAINPLLDTISPLVHRMRQRRHPAVKRARRLSICSYAPWR